MNLNFELCSGCGNTHELRDKCPNGWLYSHWSTKFVEPAQYEQEQIEINDFYQWYKKEMGNRR